MTTSLYFFICYDRPEKIKDSDISFCVPEKQSEIPECIYSYEKYDNKKYYYNKIYKVNKSLGQGEKKNEYYFEFIIGEEKYRISFDSSGKTFVYDIHLAFGKKSLRIVRNINQNKEYIEKTDIFTEALKKNKEETLLNDLYKETLSLYKKKKGFSFLIGLFVKIYKKNDLCSKLLKAFKEMNRNKKDNDKNLDRKPFLKKYIQEFQKIKSEADKYDTIDFYGIVLSYFNYYDYDNFSSIMKELFAQRQDDLFEILLIYNTHLKSPIRENSGFFNKFISYTIKNKDFDCFKKGLNYINDIETFLIAIYYCIDKNKEEILKKCQDNDEIIKLDNLKFKEIEKNKNKSTSIPSDEDLIISSKKGNNKEIQNNSEQSMPTQDKVIENTIRLIEEIIKFSKENNMVLVHFTNTFWYYILYYFREPNQENIMNCKKIRMTFIKYYELVTTVFKNKDNQIKKDAINYYEKDEFALLLDQIIRKYLNNDKTLSNIEKLGFITEYNPFYSKDNINFSTKRDFDIFDLFDLNNIDDDFVHDFKEMEFEIIFKDKLPEYIKKIMDKIRTIKNFIPTIELINIDIIDNKNLFLDILNKKFEIIIANEIPKIKGQDLKEAIDVIVQIALKNYIYKKDKKRFDFIENQIKNLDNQIISDIFIEIINVCYNKKNKEENLDEDENKDKEENSEEDIKNKKEENSEEEENSKEEENDKYKELRDYIIEEFSKNLKNSSDINNIIKIFDIFVGNNKINDKEINQNDKPLEKEFKNSKIINEILNKFIKAHSFTKDDFFSNNQNINIELLYALYKHEIIKKETNNTEEYYEQIQHLLQEIDKDIDGDIKKSKLEEFLRNDESFIIQRLSLMNLYRNFETEKVYEDLKKKNDEINKDINTLKYIKDNLILYHKDHYQIEITSMKEVIENNKNKKIKDYKDRRIKNLIEKIEEIGEKGEKRKDLKELADKINKVKNFLLFQVLYEKNSGKNEEEHFENAYNELDSIGKLLLKKDTIDNIIKNLDKDYRDIIKEIREKLSKNEERAYTFIKTLEKHYDIKDKNLMNELTILFKAKKYEIDINSIIFFFEYFQKDNEKWNKLLPKKDYQKESENDFNNIKNDLKLLQKNGIYDYTLIKPYNKLFTCLYEKNEAIDFLIKKTKDDIKALKKKIQPTDRTINIEDIISTEKCVYDITEMNNIKDNFKIFEYIKKMDPERIQNFENYSKIYNSIIELDDTADDFEDNIHAQVLKLIKNSTLSILQDSEIFLYYDEVKKKYIGNEEDEDKKNINDLINLKNQIHIKNEKEYSVDPELKSKFKDLIFFKNKISEIEVIYGYMKILRKKGSSLPIKITITISKSNDEEPSMMYKIDKNETNFEFIKKFLFDAKNTYISQLNLYYKEKFNLRFLYGKQFRTIMMHLGSDYKIDSFLRYILNNTNNKESVFEGEKITIRNADDYIKYYELYNQNSLESISLYINSLFSKNNNLSMKDHYYQMGIKQGENCKGINIYKCGRLSMEEYILHLFLEKTYKLPVAQNVLIANKETSSEEIQAFFHRAILCNFNALFVVEINDSFSEYQKSIMNSYIDNLLTYKNNLYKKEKKINIDRLKTKDYLESFIVFIYDEKNRNIIPFINEINKYAPKVDENQIIEEESSSDKNENNKKYGKLSLKKSTYIRQKYLEIKEDIDYSSKFENILVITSEVCGLGKSEKIRQMIEDQKKKYFTFQLGGILTKSAIYEKLKNLIDEIHSVRAKENLEYENIAIHLNLTESKETTIINEFFFSFLITKFYTNNENIIYVPKDIYIYIEIPNCFENYFSKFGILKIFKKDNITLKDMPQFKYSEDYIGIFNRMLGYESNEDIQEFVKRYIGVEKYSYHQINIFIKLFISQYNKFNSKLRFLEGGKDVTDKCIQEFANCTKYFTNGGFPRLLTGIIEKEEKQDYIDKLSKIFDNNLCNMKKEVFIDKLSKIFDNDLRNMKKEVFIDKLSKIYDNDLHNMKKEDYIIELSKIYNNIMKNEDYIDKLSRIYDNDLRNMKFETPLIFIIKKEEKNYYDPLMIPEKGSEESKKYQKSEDYLKRIKKILDLPYTEKDLLSIIEEKNNNYVITNDNFKKMVLLVYRIIADVPVIIMGDTGCGKTALITVLNQIIHNGGNTLYMDKMKLMGPDGKLEKEKYNIDKANVIPTLIIINIHPGITDKILCEYMEKVNKIAMKDNKEIWLFFDEMNTCLSLSLLTEIFINRTYNEKPLCKNIRFIGACNPYRRRKENKEKCGLSLSNDNEDELVYLVQPLPQSLLYYVFSFGSIDSEDEKKYIYSILQKSFTKEENTLHNITTDAISACHIYLRDKFDTSVVSLREIARFSKCIEFFNYYFDIKNNFEKKNKKISSENNKKNNKLRSIICSIYLCYYIRLTSQELRSQFEQKLRFILLKLINNDENFKEEGGDLIKAIKNNNDLKNEIIARGENIEQFSDFLKIEQDYLIEQIDLDKGIGKNTLLKENVFLLFVSVITSIPLIIIGKPGTGKSLSAQLICKSMRGKYSRKNTFFHEFKKINQIYFQGSETTQPEDVQRLFRKGENKLEHYKERKIDEKDIPIIMILFDELGLAERSKNNPLKVLHSKLEYTGKEEGISFVGISNYTLDAAKVNRALVLSVPDLDQKLGDLIDTSQNIVKSIDEQKLKDEKIFEIISKTYFSYKEKLEIIKELVVYKNYLKEKYTPRDEDSKNQKNQDELEEENKSNATNEEISKTSNNNIEYEKNTFESIKTEKLFKKLFKKEKKIRKDFHGNRDFYNLIKGIAYELVRSGETIDKDKVPIIIRYIERNFGGIEYEIDIDFDNIPEGIRKEVELIENILKEYDDLYREKIIKLNSVYLFKQLYNKECKIINPKSNLLIEKKIIKEYNLNSCINENIKDNNSRYLLLEISPTLTTLIYQNIVLQNKLKPVIELYDGSPFIKDQNKEYRFKKINKIQDDAKEDKLIVIENLNQIHPFLFDLYNMNYIIKDEKKYVRICLENFNEQLTLINERFRIVILVDKSFVKKCDLAFLNRLEKLILTFENLLDSSLKNISKNLINDINFKKYIGNYKKINYSLEDLLINCGDEDIQGLIYYFSNELKKGDEDLDNEEKKEKKTEVEKIIRNQVISKLYKILPQDIICILPNSNIIREMYNRGENIFYNFEDYINDNDFKNNKYKISIIYTFTSIANIVRGLNQEMRIMISQINSEKELKDFINELKKKNENNKTKKEYNICIDFEQSNSKIIKFVSNFIMNNIKDDEHKYNYIFIIHINRHFFYNDKKDKKSKERIYSLPDINPLINQIFIDDLNSNNEIKLKDLLTMDIKDVLDKYKKVLKLNEEFDKSLINTLTEELSGTNLDENDISDYTTQIQKYMNENKNIKNKIIEIAYNILEDDDDEQMSKCKDIIENIYNTNYIKKFTIDIISCLINYIKDNIFIKNLEKIFKKLEDNNILTTISKLQKNNFESVKSDVVEDILLMYLDILKIEKDEIYQPKFLFKYNIPGLYHFYEDISDYINKDITSNYSYIEKKLRETKKLEDKKKEEFHEKEQLLLKKVIDNQLISENTFLKELLNKIPTNLIFTDYVEYYLQKHKEKNKFDEKNDIYHKLIEILLKLRFNEENEIIQENNSLNILCIKIMWIESNDNYILNLFKIFESANKICYKLDNKIEELIFKMEENKLKYITNENKNPKHTKEVNECFYILLASICYCITSDEIDLTELTNNIEKNEIEIGYYLYNLKEINKTLQSLNNDLHLFLNEMYIIDELIKIIEIFMKKNNIKKIKGLKNLIRDNAKIIQKYPNNEDKDKLSEELVKNFEKAYELIMKDETKNDNNFYDNLRYIFYKEILKISDDNYRYKIFEKLLEIDEMVKKSNEIFQILLKKYVLIDKYNENKDFILKNNDDIITLIENKLNDNFVLSESLLYFFENSSLNYLRSKKEIIGSNNEKEIVPLDLEDEPLNILKDCYEFLNDYISEPKKFDSQKKEICKLYCLGYIKAYIYKFAKTLEDDKYKNKYPEKIRDFIKRDEKEKKENKMLKIMRLYFYKILYNDYSIDVFLDKKMIKKFGLREFNDYKKLIKPDELENIFKIDYQINTLKSGYQNVYEIIEKYRKDGFKNVIKKTSDLNIIEEYGFDNFYIISYNIILVNLKLENSRNNLDIMNNFYNNVCKPIFGNNKDKLLSNAIQLFYDINKFKTIKQSYNIDSNKINSLLFGYRYCLNELSSKNKIGIYYPLYNNGDNINEYFYPGNNIKQNYIYSSIINHFKYKPNEGCYVCLCKEGGYYHSILSGFPGPSELGKKCPKCKKPIGIEDKGWIMESLKPIKREGYYRILKDENEEKRINKNNEKKNKLKQINYMTLDAYKKKYIDKQDHKNEKGIYTPTSKNDFKSDSKIVRNLSQISFRLLNYILYSHLFFARILDEGKNDFEKYKPNEMRWIDAIYENWNILKNELLKTKINSIEKFMSYIFTALFPKLNEQKHIESYELLIKFEDELEKLIQDSIKQYKEDLSKKEDIKKQNNEDKNSFINLLKETYASYYYKEELPFYEYFYYTDYLNKKYIIEKISHMEDNKYPMLKYYLDSSNKDETDKNKYSLDDLNLFNDVLNLFNENYSNQISKKVAIGKILKNENIYKNNGEKINKCIKYYNKIKKKESKALSIDNPITDFLLIDNEFGEAYKNIYNIFIKEQNEKLEKLLDEKINKGIFDPQCKNKINIQQINENEIFTLKLPKKISFLDILYNSSYRKILDSKYRDYEIYKEFEINYDLIENYMTELLLNNKKLLNNNIIEFIDNTELFSNQVTDIMSIFYKNYIVEGIDLDDKADIFIYWKENKGDEFLYKDIIKGFTTLINYLNDIKKENNIKNENNEMEITEKTYIYKLFDKLKDRLSDNFQKLFDKKDNFTIGKTLGIFGYLFKKIFEDIKSDLDYDTDGDGLLEESKEKIDNYDEKRHPIKKKDFAAAIRLFAIFVLYFEEDKEKKIKSNSNNIINYLKPQDLWDKDVYNDENFNRNLIELKSFNLKINTIISLYDYLVRDIKDESDEAVKKLIEEREGKNKNDVKGNVKVDEPGNESDADDDSSRRDSDDERNYDDDE